MKAQDLLILGALIGGAFLLYKFFAKGNESGGGGGGAFGLGDIDFSPGALEILRTYDTRGFTIGGVPAMNFTYVAPTTTKNAVIQALQGGADVYRVKRAGGSTRTDWVGVPKTGTRAAALTVGTPQQQIERYQTGPKIVAGRKVM